MRSLIKLLLAAMLLGVFVQSSPAQANTQRLLVAADSPYPTIQAALLVAQAGDTIEVRGGIHATPLTIDKSVQIIGIDNPIIDGAGEGSLVFITADSVQLTGFTLRNTGMNNSHEDSAIIIQADHVLIANNQLENVLYGIYFADTRGGIARSNHIVGYDLDSARRGDAIRVWFSSDILIEDNEVSITRDILIWYADNITIRGNTFTQGRYGLHFMYSDNALIENNHFTHNSVGSYLMYSKGLQIIGNNLSYNRGPSGYGIALKEMDDVIVRDNWLVGNRIALYLDNSPALFEGNNEFTNNVFAYNDIGLSQLPNVERNEFRANIFLENTQQVSVQGRGNLLKNTWTVDGQGNYWSDYVGYDADANGIGDMPYRAEKLFESLTDEYQQLRFFIYSPASQALDFAAAAFPALRPNPRLIDTAPLTTYDFPNDQILQTQATGGNAYLPALILILVGGLPVFWSVYSHYQQPAHARSNS